MNPEDSTARWRMTSYTLDFRCIRGTFDIVDYRVEDSKLILYGRFGINTIFIEMNSIGKLEILESKALILYGSDRVTRIEILNESVNSNQIEEILEVIASSARNSINIYQTSKDPCEERVKRNQQIDHFFSSFLPNINHSSKRRQ